MIEADSIIAMPVDVDLPRFPKVAASVDDPFLQRVHASGKRWVVLTDEISSKPLLLLDADEFLRAAFFDNADFNPYQYCHRPIITDDKTAEAKSSLETYKGRGRCLRAIRFPEP